MSSPSHAPEPPAEAVDARWAADHLGVHIATIRRWERSGRLRGWRTPGGYRRFDAAEVRAMRQGAGDAIVAR